MVDAKYDKDYERDPFKQVRTEMLAAISPHIGEYKKSIQALDAYQQKLDIKYHDKAVKAAEAENKQGLVESIKNNDRLLIQAFKENLDALPNKKPGEVRHSLAWTKEELAIENELREKTYKMEARLQTHMYPVVEKHGLKLETPEGRSGQGQLMIDNIISKLRDEARKPKLEAKPQAPQFPAHEAPVIKAPGR